MNLQFLFASLFVVALSFPAQAAPLNFNIDGVITRPNGTALEESGVIFKVEIFSPASGGSLLLYRESFNVDMTGSGGYFSIPMGNGANAAPGAYPLDRVFGDIAMTGLVGGTTYSPGPNDDRAVIVTFTDTAGAHVFSSQNIKAVPFAINARNLEGKSASAFVQGSPAITQTNVESVFSRYATLDSILNGTFAGNAATATALAAAPGACPAGQYMTAMTATGALTCGAPAGGTGTVTNVSSGNAYITVATGTTTPFLTLNVGTAGNTVAAGNDSRFTDSRAPNGAAGGDLSGTYPNPSVAKVAGKSVVLTTPAAGEVLKYDGTNFVNGSAADATKLPLAGGTMSGAIDMASNNLVNSGFITMSASKSLHLSNNAADPAGLVAADKGKMWFNSTTGQIKFWDGAAAQPLGVAGSGLTTLNGQTGSTQTLAIGTSGTAPAWNSVTNTHTLNIPMASTAAVTAGLLSKADYDTFNTKLGAATSFSGDVSGAYNAISVDKIKATPVTITSLTTGNFLKYNGTAWINSMVSAADITSGTLGVAHGGTGATTLTSNGVLLGNGTSPVTATTAGTADQVLRIPAGGGAPSFGAIDLTKSAAVTGTLPVGSGGTGAASFSANRIAGTNGTGTALTSFTCSLNQVIAFDVSGNATCQNVTALVAGFVNGGNSFAATASLGTNDAFDLNFKTNNVNRITILSGGNVGIGTITPNSILDVAGAITERGIATPAVSAAGQGLIYFDSTSNKFRVSQNGGAYADLVSTSGGSVNNVTAGTGLNVGVGPGGSITSTGTLNVNVGTAANQIVQLDAAAKLPSVDGSALSNVNPANLSAPVPVIKGGTGTITLNSNGILLGNGTGPISATVAGAPDQVLRVSTGGGSPTFGPIDLSKSAAVTSTLAVVNGGTGATSFTANRLVATNGTGTALTTATCATGQVISFDAAGSILCQNVSSLFPGFLNGGNSFAATANIGTNDPFDLSLKTNNTSKMTIQSGGNIGIGTATPAGRLHVKGTVDDVILNLQANGVQTAPMMTFRNSANAILSLIRPDGRFGASDGSPAGTGYDFPSNTNGMGMFRVSSDTLGFSTTSTERLRIDPFGSVAIGVGIGTAPPSAVLDVSSTSTGNTHGISLTQFSADSAAAVFLGRKARGTPSSPATVVNGDLLAALQASAFDGSGWVVPGFAGYIVNGPISSGSVPADFVVTTGSSGLGVEKFRITTGGNVGIGTTSPAQKLDVVGDIRTSGCLYYASSSLGTCASDQRIKTDIHAFDLGLTALLGLNPVNFKYNGLAGFVADGKEQLGVIAQDVERTAPELVKRQWVQLHPNDSQKTEIKVVDYGAFTYVIINSIKDLYSHWSSDSAAKDEEIAALRARLDEQEKELAAIRRKLSL